MTWMIIVGIALIVGAIDRQGAANRAHQEYLAKQARHEAWLNTPD